MKKNNPLIDTSKPFVARLLSGLSGRALDIYEQKTGLQGIKETFHPMVNETILHHVGETQFPDDVMQLGGKVFDWLSSLSANSVREVSQTQTNTEQPEPNVKPSLLKGAPIPGAMNTGYFKKRE